MKNGGLKGVIGKHGNSIEISENFSAFFIKNDRWPPVTFIFMCKNNETKCKTALNEMYAQNCKNSLYHSRFKHGGGTKPKKRS